MVRLRFEYSYDYHLHCYEVPEVVIGLVEFGFTSDIQEDDLKETLIYLKNL